MGLRPTYWVAVSFVSSCLVKATIVHIPLVYPKTVGSTMGNSMKEVNGKLTLAWPIWWTCCQACGQIKSALWENTLIELNRQKSDASAEGLPVSLTCFILPSGLIKRSKCLAR